MEAGAKEVGSGLAATLKEMEAERERSWSECGIEQKINRLRDALMTVAGQGQQAGAQSHEALKIAKAHQHGGRGEVLLPVIETIGELMGRNYAEHPFERVRRLLG